MKRFVTVEKETAEEVTLCSLETATHLTAFEDDTTIDIDGFDFSDVKRYLAKGYKPCNWEESSEIVIRMDEKTAKHLMFVLGHFNSSNSSVFHPLVGASVDGETLYDEMANVLGDIFESGEKFPYKLKTAKSTFNDPVLTLTETDND